MADHEVVYFWDDFFVSEIVSNAFSKAFPLSPAPCSMAASMNRLDCSGLSSFAGFLGVAINQRQNLALLAGMRAFA